MITVRVTRREGQIMAFQIEGHSGSAESGSDVICSAVSALSQGAVVGLERVVGLTPVYTVHDGWMNLSRLSRRRLTIDQRRQAQTVLETMVVALSQVAQDYPRNVVVVDRPT